MSLKDLDEEQKASLDAMFAKDRRELADLDGKIEALEKQELLAVRKILTEEQWAEFQKIPHRPGLAHPPLLKALILPDLSPDQANKISTAHSAHANLSANYEKRASQLRGAQGQLVEKILTVSQLSELQHQVATVKAH